MLNINSLPERLKRGVQLLEEYQYLQTGENGVPIKAVQGEQVFVNKTVAGIEIVYDTEPHFYMALARSLSMKEGRHEIQVQIKKLGLMLDCSRNAVAKPDTVKRLIGLLILAGYNYLELYTEETYELPGEPYFGHGRGRYTKAELEDIVEFADAFQMEIVPCVQTLAHLRNLSDWIPYTAYMDTEDTLLVEDERTYALIRKCLRFWKDICHTKRVNIGTDEAFRLGRGKYLDQHGYVPKHTLYIRHLKRVFDVCREEGFEPEFWGDSFILEGCTEEETKIFDGTQTPIFYEYDIMKKEYYTEGIPRVRSYAGKVLFSGGLMKWIGFAPANGYSKRVINVAFEACIECGVDNILMTAWGDNGDECSPYAIMPSMWYSAEKLYICDADLNQLVKDVTGYTSDEWETCDRMNYLVPHVDKLSSAVKYLMYNDYLIGLLDCHVPDNVSEIYSGLETLYTDLSKRNSQFAYIFETYAAMSHALIRKAPFGKRIYKAYKENDKNALREIVNEIPLLKADMQRFYDQFRRFWLKENKGIGFEISDVRIGGLITRLDTVDIIVNDYLEGNSDHIYELEEERIEYWEDLLHGDEMYAPLHNSWKNSYTANHM